MVARIASRAARETLRRALRSSGVSVKGGGTSGVCKSGRRMSGAEVEVAGRRAANTCAFDQAVGVGLPMVFLRRWKKSQRGALTVPAVRALATSPRQAEM